MRNLMTVGTLGAAGLLTTGLMAFGATTAFADDSPAFKRPEDTPDVVMTVDDDDNDDTANRDNTNTNGNTNTNTNGNTNTGSSRSTNDGTNSRFTKVSRDRDLSRSDKTKDWTNDGPGKKKRDWSANSTNDRSRNDTRR
ncbi:MAG: hypothetical protein Q7T71_18540 [Herbiconiux sp.]|nr:hypothetical protein [Herbiconiux sp.]